MLCLAAVEPRAPISLAVYLALIAAASFAGGSSVAFLSLGQDRKSTRLNSSHRT